MKAFILNEDHVEIGMADFTHEEINHFTQTGSVAAKVCLTADDIAQLGIDDDDFIYVRTIEQSTNDDRHKCPICGWACKRRPWTSICTICEAKETESILRQSTD